MEIFVLPSVGRFMNYFWCDIDISQCSWMASFQFRFFKEQNYETKKLPNIPSVVLISWYIISIFIFCSSYQLMETFMLSFLDNFMLFVTAAVDITFIKVAAI
jgi:hypothetical protein